MPPPCSRRSRSCAGRAPRRCRSPDGRGTVRIVASTYFVDGGGGIMVDGTALSGAYTLSVIGPADTMRTAMTIPGGVADLGRPGRRYPRCQRTRPGHRQRSSPARETSSTRSRPTDRPWAERCDVIPEDLHYTDQHEWVAARTSGVRVGITHFAQDSLGDIVFVSLPEPGTAVEAGQSLGEVESTKSVSEIYAPVSGTVTARNDELNGRPGADQLRSVRRRLAGRDRPGRPGRRR